MITATGNAIWVFAHHAHGAYRIDPASNRLAAAVHLRKPPCTLATTGAGLMWNSSCGGPAPAGSISFGIDPRTDLEARRLPGVYPVVGAGSLWLLGKEGLVLRRVNPNTGVLLVQVPLGRGQVPAGESVVLTGFSHGSVWLGSDDAKAIALVSVKTNRVTLVIRLPGARTEDELFPQADPPNTGAIHVTA